MHVSACAYSPAFRTLRQEHALSSSRPILFDFLAPALRRSSSERQQRAQFSTTTRCFPRDMNRQRGMSALRRTGLRRPLAASKYPLPRPVLNPKNRAKPIIDTNHGLWQFFGADRKSLNTPEEDNSHGRPWTVEELRHKSWEDLHRLFWVCAKERNRVATQDRERSRLRAGYGDYESVERDGTIRRTQRAIKQALTERYYSWEDARALARSDPEVRMEDSSVTYSPSEAEDYLYERTDDEQPTKQ